MNDRVSWNVEATIKPGQAETFRALMEEMITSTRDEPGTLRYEWFAAGDSVHILETYADSEAGLIHLGTLGQRFAERLLALVDVERVCVYGDPTDALREALAGFGADFLTPLGGFAL